MNLVVKREVYLEALNTKKLRDKQKAMKFFSDLLTIKKKVAIVDTETDGVDECAEIIQFGMVSLTGKVLVNTLVKPLKPVDSNSKALRVNGLNPKLLEKSPNWDVVHSLFLKSLQRHNIELLISYNRAFDRRLYVQTCKLNNIEPIKIDWQCAMLPYADYVGDWNIEKRSYTYPKLPNAKHGAIEDCYATIELIERIGNEKRSSLV